MHAHNSIVETIFKINKYTETNIPVFLVKV